MQEVFRHSDAGQVSLRQSLLESEGIQTYIRNLNTQQTLGGLAMAVFPIPEFWPTLCVVNDDDYQEAIALLHNSPETRAAEPPGWTCLQCKEHIPGNFGVCWNCGSLAQEDEC